MIKRFLTLFSLTPFFLFAKPFVTADVKGRLGNQLFEIAAAVSLALDNDAEAKFPAFSQGKKNNIEINYQKVFWRININPLNEKISTTYKEPHYQFAPIPYTPNMKISGFFQSEKYFKHHKDEIIELFSPSEEILTYLESNYGLIIDNPKTVAVHVRCYHTESKNLQKVAQIYYKDYYLKMMSYFDKDYLFVIFSDDTQWCKEQFANCGYNVKIIENEPPYHDIYLMSLFKNIIISNSSFSWWAAYLNKHPDKVIIAPQKWIKNKNVDDSDVVPEDWLILD